MNPIYRNRVSETVPPEDFLEESRERAHQFTAEIASRILAGLLANPNVVAHSHQSGFALVNTNNRGIAALAVDLAKEIERLADANGGGE